MALLDWNMTIPLAESLFVGGLKLMVVGMTVVFVALIVIGAAISVASLVFGKAAPEAIPLAESRPTPVATDADEARRLVAVLTAAATAALGKQIVLKRVTFLSHNTVSGWAEAGRMAIQGSHNLRRGG